MSRKEGYYWVIYDNKKWEVAFYDQPEEWWYRCNIDYLYTDKDFDKINENPILPPNE
jgi:hypothetical protein